MSKFDHRLKRLEKKTGSDRRQYKIWMLSISDMKKFTAGKLSSTDNRPLLSIDKLRKSLKNYREQDKNIFVISAVPRLNKKALKEKDSPPSKRISFSHGKEAADLTDAELEAEIASIRKELEK